MTRDIPSAAQAPIGATADGFTDLTLGQQLEFWAREVPNHEFLVYPDRNLRWTYREFDERVNRLAKGMLAIGIGKGDHVGIWAKNVPDWLVFQFACAKTGAVLVTVNTAYKAEELDYVLRQSDMKMLGLIDGFRDVDYIQIISQLVPELKEQPRDFLNSKTYPHLRHVCYVGQEKHRGMYTTAELMLLGDHQPDSILEEAQKDITCQDIVNMQYTSGTTGFPKGVMLTHHNILNNGWSIGHRQHFTANDKLCLQVPLFHCFGVTLGVMAILSHGATIVAVEVFDPLLGLAAIHKERCTVLYGVPTMFIAMYSHPMFNLFDMTSLRTGIMAGSVCPMEVMKRVISDMHVTEITSVYGLTEASPGITQSYGTDPVELRVSTVGTAFPGVEVAILHPETNAPLPPNTEGEVCCRGYNIMKGYYNMPEQTAAVIDENGWLHTGDLGTCDENGYYCITGRIKDIIIRGGENISPKEIEDLLLALPGVQDVQVIGAPDEKYGEIPVAFIIPTKDSTLAEEDVRDHVRSHLASYKVPRYVFFVSEYPLTASGKIQKFKLREQSGPLVEQRRAEE
ncbi:MAG: AMP-binding protein [Lentisphaerae bacterium]|jgi:fatty-acyl-CoA synthase|nr:AMP-binding protein [Lentisphaerota bacterium]